MIESLACVLLGVLLTLGYASWRMMRADGWDKSNMTNPIRVLSHIVMHAGDLAFMYYAVRDPYNYNELIATRKAFPYIGQDEISEVVQTRPTMDEMI